MATIHPKTLSFLSSLKKNNNKPWFEANRDQYELIRNDLISFAADLIKEINKFDKSIGFPDPKKCLFRINRDIRFSKDKSPYKTSFGIAISASGKNFQGAGYYVHLEPGSCFLGGGMWMPEAGQLKKVRQEIDYHFRDFKKIVESPAFKKQFGKLDDEGKLSRPPKEYAADNPAIEYLKFRSYTVGTAMSDKESLSPTYRRKAATVFKSMYPFISFLNRSLG